MANGVGLAGLHRAEALCLASLGETAAAPPSERKGRVEKDEWVYGAEGAKKKGCWGKGDCRLIEEKRTPDHTRP